MRPRIAPIFAMELTQNDRKLQGNPRTTLRSSTQNQNEVVATRELSGIHRMMNPDTSMPISVGKYEKLAKKTRFQVSDFLDGNRLQGLRDRDFCDERWPRGTVTSSQYSVLMNTMVETRECHERFMALIRALPFGTCTARTCMKRGLWAHLI